MNEDFNDSYESLPDFINVCDIDGSHIKIFKIEELSSNKWYLLQQNKGIGSREYHVLRKKIHDLNYEVDELTARIAHAGQNKHFNGRLHLYDSKPKKTDFREQKCFDISYKYFKGMKLKNKMFYEAISDIYYN